MVPPNAQFSGPGGEKQGRSSQSKGAMTRVGHVLVRPRVWVGWSHTAHGRVADGHT